MGGTYVHGYDPREAQRLQDQAGTLRELLHSDTVYPKGHTVLEAGCGIGAQTLPLAAQNPDTRITSVDVSEISIAEAQKTMSVAGLTNVTFQQADIFHLPFEPESFDHVFLCFVLEHLPNARNALDALKRVLKPGGTITAIEGDHGSAYFHPDSVYARKAIDCLVTLQSRGGGDALIGRKLYPLFRAVGLDHIHVSPRMVYADPNRPDLVDGFTRKTFTAMIEGVRHAAIAQGLAAEQDFDRGVADLYKTAEEDGVFCYTFFKAVGIKRN